MIWNEILCLGDSITAGARDEYGRSYPAELGKILTEQTGEFYYCHNYSKCGDTSSDLQHKVWNAARSHRDANLALIMIGTNDVQAPTPVEVYEDNLRQIISVVRVHGMTPILATLPALGETPLYLKNLNYIQKYNYVIHKLSQDMNFTICDMFGSESDYIDGVHYTHEGYKALAARWAKAIANMYEEAKCKS